MVQIFLLVGAPAVGKSSTAKSLAARFPKSIHIPVDDLRMMVVSGLVQPGQWETNLIEQLRLARESAIQMALTYNAADFYVVIDDFWDPHSQLNEYDALFKKSNVHKIVLYPSQLSAEERNLKRSASSEISEYLLGGIREVYFYLQTQAVNLERTGWLLLDTTDISIEETVDLILKSAVS